MTPLSTDGIVVAPLATVPGQAWMAKAVHGAAAVFRRSTVVAQAEAALRTTAVPPRTFELDRGRVRMTPGQKVYLVQQPCEALQAWALQPGVLAWVSSLAGGLTPALHSSHLWLALVPPAWWAPMMSQCWHRDPYEDGMDRLIKVFWYLMDVDEQAGPFEYLRGSQERTKPTDPRLLASRYIHPAETARLEAHPSRLVCTGPRDTLIAADTSGIHRGGLCRTTPRLSATVVYGYGAR